MASIKVEKRYVPTLLKTVLLECDYKRKDDLVIIIDLIYRKQIYFRNNLQKNYGYVEIPRAAFEKIIPSPNTVKAAIDYLIEQGIISRNDSYEADKRAKAYKIEKKYLGAKVGIELTDTKMIARLKKQKMAMRKVRVKNMEFQKTEYYKTFKINEIEACEAIKNKATIEILALCEKIDVKLNIEQAHQLVDCSGKYGLWRNIILQKEDGKELHSILHRVMLYQQHVHSIADGWLYFKRNKTNGRLDSNLTSLPTFLRKYIVSNEVLYNIDLKNSQPFFLYTKLKNNSDVKPFELAHYGDLVTNGTLYEYLQEKWFLATGKEKDRAQMKKMLFSIFYSKITSFRSYKDFFRGVFPTIMEAIDTTNAEQHNTLAIAMQTLESHSILDVVMPALKEQNIVPFTIHDSFVVSSKEVMQVKATIKEKFQLLFGLVPALHEENLLQMESDNCEDGLFDISDLATAWNDDEDNNEIIERIAV
jgi:hypothetical protein